MNPTANNASIARVMVTKDDVNTRFCNRRKSMIGSTTRRSTPGTASKATKPTAKQRMDRHELQPHSGAKESASLSNEKPVASKTAPNGSKRWRALCRVCRSPLCEPIKPQIPIGRVRENIQRQLQRFLVIAPSVG